jgi:hypothetical protein
MYGVSRIQWQALEPFSYTNGEDFLDLLSNYCFLKSGDASWDQSGS